MKVGIASIIHHHGDAFPVRKPFGVAEELDKQQLLATIDEARILPSIALNLRNSMG
jgi:hypothetical protein